jgi:hypothetical protein
MESGDQLAPVAPVTTNALVVNVATKKMAPATHHQKVSIAEQPITISLSLETG